MSAAKQRFPAEEARAVADEISARLLDSGKVERLEVAGSLRRNLRDVGDVEIVYVPKTKSVEVGLFGEEEIVDHSELVVQQLLGAGVLAKRPNKNGSTSYGAKNKLLIHVESGIPVDLFATTEASWFNYLVCRTGGSQSNISVAHAAKKKGWQWNPYGVGFSRPAPGGGREEHPVHSEAEVFEFVGLPCLPPEGRR